MSKKTSLVHSILLIFLLALVITMGWVYFLVLHEQGMIDEFFIRNFKLIMIPIAFTVAAEIVRRVFFKNAPAQSEEAANIDFILRKGGEVKKPIGFTSREKMGLILVIAIVIAGATLLKIFENSSYSTPLSIAIGLVVVLLLLFVPSVIRKKSLTPDDIAIQQQQASLEKKRQGNVAELKKHYWFFRLSDKQQTIYLFMAIVFGLSAKWYYFDFLEERSDDIGMVLYFLSAGMLFLAARRGFIRH